MIYICKPSKISIYVNTEKKTTAQIKAETGCTALINGGIFNMNTFKPLCHLKAEGRVLAKDQYSYWGFGWNTADLTMVQDYTTYKNYICCVCLVHDGKPIEKLTYNPDMGGYRPRTALGVFEDGRVWLYAATSPLYTPEQLQRAAVKAGVKHAIMLDGGGSTQWGFPSSTKNGARRVHNYICVWEAENEPVNDETKGASNLFKLALGAGHALNTAGKRCLKSLDPNETREWVLNDRICDYVESYLKEYEGYSLVRLDDSDDGRDDITLASRVNKANAFGADFYLSVHHNAGAGGTTAGGIEAYSYTSSSKASVEWRDELYDSLIEHTGLKGNRSKPKTTANFYVLKHTAMPAVLLELGYMDSKTDVPVILTEDYAKKCAEAIVEVIVRRGGLKKKGGTSTQVETATKTEGAKTVTVNLPQLEKGDKCTSVKALQQLLTANGYDTKGADGIFGANTKSALEKFQKAKGLTADGICGKATWTALLI